MSNQDLQTYLVFYYDGWHIPEPVYYFVAMVTGESHHDALDRNRHHLFDTVRRILNVGRNEVAEYKLEEALHIVREKDWLTYYSLRQIGKRRTPINHKVLK